MQIRPATPTDVSAVLPMVASICTLHKTWDSAKYGFLPNPQQRYEQWLTAQAKSDKSIFLVAEDAQTGHLRAFLVGTVERGIPIYRLREFGFIHDLWVEPSYRRAGVAKQMVMLAIEHFQSIGVKQIRLDTAVANEAGRQLFGACGFRVSTVEMLIELEI
ncbi:GNAT family N-acetyltransferase [Gloeocapsopsis sp. IPPAS B-1203]|uniref:GNAT family N-acetyltransferase n=1 Tax=Gloeocapsopsis sp. IPPAS B-1203 TaxID=2049454 RepID=UPI000C1A58F4|nr:GNAT family N-acetyltransferase [Gloeocapsopsis sp. IPPAS B-1203]PIG90521.1 GNAT family N-acetyltransferase [Gloeocapsopsis sp. IPPAS B-1203]